MPISLSRLDDVAVLNLGDDENRMSPEWIDAVGSSLDEVTSWAPIALVTTSDSRFYSNGLDLDWLGAHLDQYDDYLTRVEALIARVLTLPVPTVAALPGHAFGMGALLALAHDFRWMRRDRGFFCFPEVDLKLPFSPGMVALIRAKLPSQTALEAMTTGRRYGGEEAEAEAIVHGTSPLKNLGDVAVVHASSLAKKDPQILSSIKHSLYGDVVTLLERTDTAA